MPCSCNRSALDLFHSIPQSRNGHVHLRTFRGRGPSPSHIAVSSVTTERNDHCSNMMRNNMGVRLYPPMLAETNPVYQTSIWFLTFIVNEMRKTFVEGWCSIYIWAMPTCTFCCDQRGRCKMGFRRDILLPCLACISFLRMLLFGLYPSYLRASL